MKKLLFIISVVAASCVVPETKVESPKDSTSVDSGLVVKVDTSHSIKDTVKLK